MANEKRLIDANAWKTFYEEKKNILDRFYTHDAGYEDALDNVDDWMDAQTTVEVAEMKWIPVSERLPEEPGEYLVFSKAGNYSIQYFYITENYKNFLYVENGTITHWMPLPQPPKGE